MKRLSTAVTATAMILACGLFASACEVVPYAASVNGTTISVSSFNGELHDLQGSVAADCLVQVEYPQLASSIVQGSGGQGTVSMPFADALLSNKVARLVAAQYSASRGIAVSSSDLVSAKSDYEAILDGEISSAVQQASASGIVPSCQTTTGSNLTGAQLLSALPADVQASQIKSQAVEEKLLTLGANITDQAVAAFYAANQALFTLACVGVIATDTQAHATQLVAQLDFGASFAAVAKASSLDQQTAANGGQLGCNYSESTVKQALGLQSITVGAPIAPVQDPNSGQWVIYEVTSQTVVPLSAAAQAARRELTQSTPNVSRVTKELTSFVRRSSIAINPQYGTWRGISVVPPVAPPPQYLLSAVAGDTTPAIGPGFNIGGSSGTTGTTGPAGSTGTSSGG